jgi:hypothetical protein
MKTIKWIIRYRREGYSWGELYRHLRENGVLTAKGKPWSIMRIRRVYQAVVKGGMVPAGLHGG